MKISHRIYTMTTTSKTTLLFDANNILYRTFFGHIDEDEEVIIGMCHHAALWSFNKFYRAYPADEIVVAFDSYSWRKEYTNNGDCITYKKYKGHRRKDLTPKQQKKLDAFDLHVKEFANMLKTQTSLIVLEANLLEADDLIAGYVQKFKDNKHILISSDKDYMQLLVKHNLTLIDPDSGKPRSLSEWNNDPELFLFEKCFRGDASDNIMSAYPRLRKTKLVQAYTDEFLKENLMQNEFTILVNSDEEADEAPIKELKFKTEDVFYENQYLVDLEKQPKGIRKRIDKTIEDALNNRSTFNYVSFVKFCTKYDLKNILDRLDNFVPMLAGKNLNKVY